MVDAFFVLGVFGLPLKCNLLGSSALPAALAPNLVSFTSPFLVG
jgi:hypothetical protein